MGLSSYNRQTALQELAPLAQGHGCCGFTGPFPPPLLMSIWNFDNLLYPKTVGIARGTLVIPQTRNQAEWIQSVNP